MCSRKSLIKICLEDGEEVFLMSEYESKKSLALKILDIKHNTSYVGEVSDLDLRTQAAGIRLAFSDFMERSMQALFQKPSEEFSFIYTLLKNGESHKFKWKVVDADETVIEIGCVEMSQHKSVSILDNVLVCLAKEIRDLHSSVKSLTDELVECQTQKQNAINQLSEAIDIKDNLEKELFSKFVLVLNEKKRKIREIESGKSHDPSIPIKAFKSKKVKMHVVSESSEEDVDWNLNVNKPGFSRILKEVPVSFHQENEFLDLNEPGPSNVVKKNSLPFLDDDDESIVPLKPCKIRNRNTGNKKKAFPEEVMSSNVESALSQLMDDDSDEDLLENL